AAYSVLKGTLFSILPEMNPVNLPGRFWAGFVLVLMVSIILNPAIILISVYPKKSLSLLSRQKMNYAAGYSYRQLLTVVQFVIIVFLMTSILGIQKQLGYLKSRDS